MIVGENMLSASTKVGCAECEDGFEVKDSRCV